MRHWTVAFDISTGEAPPDGASTAQKEVVHFEEFLDADGVSLMRLLALACDDEALSNRSGRVALMKTQQRWKRLQSHPHRLGWAFGAGLDEADKTLRDRPPTGLNESTGGYVRGLPLDHAVAALPLQQRAALVAAYCAGWTDDHIAAGFEVDTRTVLTRRTRALAFLAHHLRIDTGEVPDLLVAHFLDGARAVPTEVPEVGQIRRSARRRTLRDVLFVGLGLLGLIALGGAIFQSTRSEEVVAEGPEPVFPPNTSIDWFDPIGDDRGGFVALNTRGASRFVATADGDAWVEAAVWNSRAIDLRTEVTSFTRSGGRYIATIEAPDSITSFVSPRIAMSTNLSDWSVRDMALEEPQFVDGLQRRYRIVQTAWAESKLLVAVEVVESLDYRALAIGPGQVCAEVASAQRRLAHLCDGGVIEVSRAELPMQAQTRYFLAEGSQGFVEVSLLLDPRSVVSTGNGFAGISLIDGASHLSFSVDGLNWPLMAPAQESERFLLVEGDRRGRTMQITPSEAGWSSLIFEDGAPIGGGSLPLTQDPRSIWSRPDLASGPSGWALFVTTSRPWERSAETPGWAVDTGDWIVSKLPDSDVVTLRSEDGSLTYRFLEEADQYSVATDGAVTLTDPASDEVLVEIPAEVIAASRSVSTLPGGVKSEVFFSADGLTWRSIWQSTEDAWFGSVSVGDDEVLLSGVHLAGRPIAIPIDGDNP